MAATHTNRLAREKSPYLLQHAHNPVDWFAWNDEAFSKARAEDKPILLSIGYSTCHWCHVMERESFEDEKIGAFLNEHFVSIKVDREERPDVDKIYMTFVQSTAGGGGWPLNVFLTPTLRPFFGGTYFPPDARYGRPSFLQLLQQIAQLWSERRSEIAANADELHTRLELIMSRDAPNHLTLTPEVLRRAAELFKSSYDPVHGGFGGAPKFPQPAIPLFLLRAARRFGDAGAVEMVLHTCERMAAGGIHDQLGGGFARYSVDAEWLVPHFEKMLYDNAQLVQLYLDAHLCQSQSPNFKSPIFADTARDILDYVLRDMTHPDGGFFSAEDADSEGHEGKFYCWTQDELTALLAPEEFAVAARYFGITPQGNFLDHSHPQPLPGQNVLSRGGASADRRKSAGNETAALCRDTAADEKLLASAKQKMFAARERRIRPQRDDKVLASWNGLMLGAFARAAAVLGDEKYRAAAEKNLAFLREKLWEPPAQSETAKEPSAGGGTLFHRWRDGVRDRTQLLEDYACVLDGALQLYETTLEPRHLDFACELADAMVGKFFDAGNGGFWQSAANTKHLILRVKDDYDGAEPSGNSVATFALLKLAAITGREAYRKPAEATLQLFADRLHQQPAALAFMLQAVDFWLDEPDRVVIAGDPGSDKFRELLLAAHSVYHPNKVVLGNGGPVEPFAKTLPAKGGAAVYLCTGSACQPPTSAPDQVKEMLR